MSIIDTTTSNLVQFHKIHKLKPNNSIPNPCAQSKGNNGHSVILKTNQNALYIFGRIQDKAKKLV